MDDVFAEGPEPHADGLEPGAPPSDSQLRAAWDSQTLDAALDAVAACGGDDGVRRVAAAKAIRAARKRALDHLEATFWRDQPSGLDAARALAWVADQTVVAAYDFVVERLIPLANPTTSERICLAAVGGFGRGQMAPYSDVDLLFLTPYKPTGWIESVIENTLYILWDLKLKVGHASRTVAECLRMAGQDVTIRTALLERRRLAGSQDLYRDLDQRLWSELFERTGPQFVEAKLAERDERHTRTGGSRYLLEPSVKDSKGGLRDLQTLLWIAKYLYRSDSLGELTAKRVFTEEEAARWRTVESHHWRVRCGLHYLVGRAQEKLTFDLQVELAERFGYRDRAGQRGVERFMKRYFLAAKQVGDLTRIFCAALEQQHKKSAPLLAGLRRLMPTFGAPTRIEDWTELVNGRIGAKDRDIYARDPLSMLRIIDVAIRAGARLRPADLRLIHRHRRGVDDAFRADPAARQLFVDLIAKSNDPPRALRRLSETGLLARFVPEFGRVTGMMQFNMYHHYTVDEHTVLAVDVLNRIISGDLASEHPIETEIARGLADPTVITVALLLHDIGKGLPEDHSIAGERIARDVCPALGLGEAETEQVAWLVRWHLAMSDVAQKRDIADPATVRDFAELVRSPSRLQLLYLLTVCDIRAVGPGVWNNWKAQLLRNLYQETRARLSDEASGLSFSERVAEAKLALRARLAASNGGASGWSDVDIDVHLDRFFPTYWTGLSADTHEIHARMARDYAAGAADADGGVLMRDAPSKEREATKIAFHTPDHPGLFARMAGALALVGADVLDARAYTTRDGMAMNTFWVQDDRGRAFAGTDELAALRRSVRRTLRGEVVARDALRSRRKLKPRERPFDVAPSITIDNGASDVFTLVEVEGRDRVGLLYDLARALAGESVSIFSAIIATYGEHAVDVFYVKDVFGLKIDSRAKQARIEAALLRALEASGEDTIA